MNAFSAHILAQGAATLDDLEAAIKIQVSSGGDLATSLLEAGVLRDGALQRLWAEFHRVPLGPRGALAAPSDELWQKIPPGMARRFRVFPIDWTPEVAVVAVDEPLSRRRAEALEAAVGQAVKAVLVTPLRLAEALYRHCDLGMTEQQRWLVAMLAAGRQPRRGARDAFATHSLVDGKLATVPYRRMSEQPEGIRPAGEQPLHRLPAPEELRSRIERWHPEESESVPSTRPYDEGTPPPMPTVSSVPPPRAEPHAVTCPYDSEEQAEKRNTQPWRDDENEEENAPISVSGEFSASLIEQARLSEDARIHEDQRRFRHRGPFTRAQAEHAAMEAGDVHLLLEVFMRYARQYFERSILLVMMGGELELRLSHGLTRDLADLRLSLEEPGVLRHAYRTGDPVVAPLGIDGGDVTLRRRLNVTTNHEVAVVPLCVRERVVAIFYGDDRSDAVDRAAVDDVTDFTEICAAVISRLILARKRRSG